MTTYRNAIHALTTLAAELLMLRKEVRLEHFGHDGAVLTTGDHTVIHDGRRFLIVESLELGADHFFGSPCALETAEAIRDFDWDLVGAEHA